MIENLNLSYQDFISPVSSISTAEKIVLHAVRKVEEKIADNEFDLDRFACDMSISKSTLYRKLKSITGLSPSSFIRNVRLTHASNMMVDDMGNIAEIAFLVGFNDPKYFSKCFKEKYGVTPSEYKKMKMGL